VADAQTIAEPALWRLPLDERMAHIAEIREISVFPQITVEDPFSDQDLTFYAVLRHAEVLEISRRPLDFCSGRGSTAIADFPPEIMEFFSSFIAMDDPRHARQRGIVARSFTPRHLQGVLDSVEQICDEVIDAMCEQGEVDLVEAVSEPFPLLIICDMMGIPRSEFSTVLQATNVILGAGDPETVGAQEDPVAALIDAGVQLAALMNDLADHRREHPADDLTTALVHADVGEDVLARDELAAFFILLAVAGNDTTRNAISHGVNLLSQNPQERARWQSDLTGGTTLAVEELVRAASPVTFMRRTLTRDLTLSGHDFREGDRVVLFYGAANRDPRVFEDPERLDLRRDPNPHVGFGGPGPHFCLGAHLARRELAVVFPRLLTRLPDIEVTGEAEMLQSMGIPLVAGIKHLPVRFTPSPPVSPRP
jgi:cytochrome P450